MIQKHYNETCTNMHVKCQVGRSYPDSTNGPGPYTLRIQNTVSFAIVVSVAILKNRSNIEITFHIVVKTQFNQIKNLFDRAFHHDEPHFESMVSKL